jgi:multisubunit Na+/H+ antiporter MnhG subunit
VADLNGASGLVAGASRQRIPVAIGYVIAASASIAVVWAGDIFTVIAWASKAFVLYYGIQSATALVVEWVDPAPTRWGRIVLHGSAIAIALAVLTLGRAAAG